MSKKWMYRFLAVLVIAATGVLALGQVGSVSAAPIARFGVPGGNRGGQGAGPYAGQAPAAGAALTPLSAAEGEALQKAILEEYGALNLYQAVIDQFGAVYPFTMIAQGEQQHVNVLLAQAAKYGVTAPANPGLANPLAVDSLTQACQLGVEAEIADAALYDELMAVTAHSDLLRVYANLQSASLNNHLPAFEACN